MGDFTWPGFDDDVVVTDRVLGALQARFSGFEAGSVEMVDAVGDKRRGGVQVRLPYDGPPLHELWVTTWLDADRDRSSLELERRCGSCGAEFWELFGAERWDSHLDPQVMELVRTHSDRMPGAGVYIPAALVRATDIFRVRELPGWLFCTEQVRDLVVQEGFSNVSFLEMGETF